MKIDFIKILIIIKLIFIGNIMPLKAAEEIIFYKGIFSRKILVKDLEEFVKTNKPNKKISNLIKLSNQKKEDVSILIKQEFDLPLVLTSNILNGKIGNVIIKRASKIIYPNKNKNPNISMPAIRSGIIKGIVLGGGKINLILFFKSYPNKVIAIDVDSLSKTIDKVESMSDLINFFSNSPLEKLKEGGSNT